MNQLGGVGAGGIPGRSYAFAPSADGTHKQFYCNHRFVNVRLLIYPKKDKNGFTTIAKYPDNIEFRIFFSDRGRASNTFSFFTTTNIPKGTTYKLKGSGIEETIFTVEGLDTNIHRNFNFYTIKFSDPNINSGKEYRYNNKSMFYSDPQFELSIKS